MTILRSLSTCFLALILHLNIHSQIEIDSLGFETFTLADQDTSYLMKKYFMVFLKEGPHRDQSKEELSRIQEAHLEHLGALAEEGKICIAGPFGDDGAIKGIVIFNVPTLEEVEKFTKADPAVKAGRLIMEVHPWWAAKGSSLN